MSFSRPPGSLAKLCNVVLQLLEILLLFLDLPQFFLVGLFLETQSGIRILLPLFRGGTRVSTTNCSYTDNRFFLLIFTKNFFSQKYHNIIASTARRAAEIMFLKVI